MQDRKTVIVPAGIGDWSWIWSKLINVRDQISRVEIVYGTPLRTKPYVELCGFAPEDVDYRRGIGYAELANFTVLNKPKSWADYTKNGQTDLFVEANWHLEQGLPLVEWLTDLEPAYHYPLYTTDDDEARATRDLVKVMDNHPVGPDGPVLAFSCASFQGAEAWNAWQVDEWKECLTRIMGMGWRPLAIGGSWDDLTYTVACDLDLPDLVGKHRIGTTIRLLDKVEGYMGYSSGLNVIRTVLDRPAFALWPRHQNALMYSWAPPRMIEERRYVGSLYHPVERIWPVVRAFLRVCEKETGRNTIPTP